MHSWQGPREYPLCICLEGWIGSTCCGFRSNKVRSLIARRGALQGVLYSGVSLCLRASDTRQHAALQFVKQSPHPPNHSSPISLTFFSFLSISISISQCLCRAASSKPTSLCNSVQWDLIRAMQQSDCRQATNLSVMILRQLRFHSFDKERSFSRNRREIGVLLAMSVLTASSAISSE